MKRLKIIIVFLLIGSIMAFVNFNTKDDGFYTKTIAFQLGVFNDENNALRLKERLGGIVIKENNLYRVYFAVLHDKDNIKFIEKTLDDRGISYYIRNVDLDESNFLKGDKYETLMNKSVKDKSKLKVNTMLLDLYKESL